MKKTGACPKCSSTELLLIDSLADTGKSVDIVRPLHVAMVTLPPSFLGVEVGTAGKLGAVVCRDCGFTELYTHSPASIPVDGKRVRLMKSS